MPLPAAKAKKRIERVLGSDDSCYPASEALYHAAGGKRAGWKPVYVKHEGTPHWFLRDPKGRPVDLTADQFDTPVPYDEGTGKGFLTKCPSKRSKTILERAKIRVYCKNPTPEAPMSPRAEIAQRIATFVLENDMAQVFGGDVVKSGRYYEIGFSLRRTLDGSVRVYGPKFIQVAYGGSYGRDSKVFDSEANAVEFLRLAFVKFDMAAADDVPVKGEKPPPKKPSPKKAPSPARKAPSSPRKAPSPKAASGTSGSGARGTPVAVGGIDAVIGEIDCLIDDLDDANARGFMRRVPQSRHYRKPPAGAAPGVPSQGEIRALLTDLRIKARVRAGGGPYEGSPSELHAAASVMRNWLLTHGWEEESPGVFRGRCVDSRCNRWVIDGAHLLWQFNKPCGWFTFKDYPLVKFAKGMTLSGEASSKRPTPKTPSKRPSAKQPVLRIEDDFALSTLAQLEGTPWAQRQHQGKLKIDNGFFLSLRARQILLEMGDAAKGLTLEDLDPAAGLITGSEGAAYVVFPDGEIVLVGDTVSAAVRKVASAVLRVV
jgi:hypothetical protein